MPGVPEKTTPYWTSCCMDFGHYLGRFPPESATKQTSSWTSFTNASQKTLHHLPLSQVSFGPLGASRKGRAKGPWAVSLTMHAYQHAHPPPINTHNAPPIRVFERKTARPARRVEALPHAAPREPRRPSDGPTDRRSDATGRAVTSTPWVIGVAEWLWRLKPLTLGRPSGVFVLNSFGRSIRGMVGSKTQGKGWVVCIG